MKRSLVVLALCALSGPTPAQTLGNHRPIYDQNGILRPWTSWRDAVPRFPRSTGYAFHPPALRL